MAQTHVARDVAPNNGRFFADQPLGGVLKQQIAAVLADRADIARIVEKRSVGDRSVGA